MNLAKTLTILGAAAMAGSILYAFMAGDFAAEGAILTSMPWGIVSLVDLYVGFILFSAWVIYREKSLPVAILWVVAVMTLGAFAISLYAFLALRVSRDNWQKFFMGKHSA